MDWFVIGIISNLCRTYFDVLHIVFYILIVVFALIISLRSFDKKLFENHLYLPYMNFITNIRYNYLPLLGFIIK